MKRLFTFFAAMLLLLSGAMAQQFSYSDSWGKAGFNLVDSKSNSVEVVYSITNMALEDMQINGSTMKNIMLPGTFLFNDAGAPNLPGTSRYVAIPEGATAKLRIISQRTVTLHNVDIAPALVIPSENDDAPLVYQKNTAIYNSSSLYPAHPVQISEVTDIRGVDVVLLGITPFQYNPVTKDLIVYRDLRVAVDFEGGNGNYGDPAFRSQYWDPILKDNLLNEASLPVIDYTVRLNQQMQNAKTNECEYIIISPTGPAFLAWADTIAKFRNEQGILTHVFTIDEVGGNTTSAIEAFINDAYNNWTIKPAACLLLGDYGTDPASTIIAPIWNNYCASDNIYADVNNDDMPDVVMARMTANNETQLTTFITKFLSYERNPETDTAYYNHPITALGWQTERWFQLCSEIIGGYFKIAKGRQPVRINAVYQGNPSSDPWSTAQNTGTILNTFGPNGLGYIPQTPQQLGGFSGGTAAQINNAINAGAFFIQHRDHGNVTLWGEPAYNNGNIGQLTNTKLIHVFSINCLTGKYNNSAECFVEKFHRHTKNGYNSGALSVTGASETSYSFVNDTYVWGMIDNMWPGFMPQYGTTPASRGINPAFGNAAGKYFLKQSNWPYNTGDKKVTYYLFHHHGDAFQTLYDTVPATLEISHDSTIAYGTTTFNITATDSAFICLSVNGEILATAYGDGATPIVMTIPVLDPGTNVVVTVTKQNYFRYRALVPVETDQLLANFSANATNTCAGSAVSFNDESTGSPTAWEWTFEGGEPGTSTEQNPQNISYANPGSYTVTLSVTKDGNTMTETKTAYIHVYNYPVADFSASNLCEDVNAAFTDLSGSNGGEITAWEWNFGDTLSGPNNLSNEQNPAHIYSEPGTYTITLTVTNNGTCSSVKTMDVTIFSKPAIAAKPEGQPLLCQGSAANLFTTTGAEGATSYLWEVTPDLAGTFTTSTNEGSLDLAPDFTGEVNIIVKGINDCGEGDFSEALTVNVAAIPVTPNKPEGPDTADVNVSLTGSYTTGEVTGATSYIWTLEPAAAGNILSNGTTGTVSWDASYRGTATVTVQAYDGSCSSFMSDPKDVIVRSTLGIGENNPMGLSVYPNPTSGKLNLSVNANGISKVDIRVYNILGNLVYSENGVEVSRGFVKTLNLSSLSSGIYHLKVEGNGKSVISRIIITD